MPALSKTARIMAQWLINPWQLDWQPYKDGCAESEVVFTEHIFSRWLFISTELRLADVIVGLLIQDGAGWIKSQANQKCKVNGAGRVNS